MKLKEVLKYFHFLDECQVFIVEDSMADPSYVGDIYSIPWQCVEHTLCEEYGICLQECKEKGREVLTFYVEEY